MSKFKYTYNIESFEKFFKTTLFPALKPLSDKRFLPLMWMINSTATQAFDVTCKTLGRFSAYEVKPDKELFGFLKALHFFPDFFEVKFKGCFKGQSNDKNFDIKSLELIKNTGRTDITVWDGILISVPYYKKTQGNILFKKYDTGINAGNVINVILKQKNYEDITEKEALREGESFCSVIKQNYNIMFTKKGDREEFLNEEFCKKLFMLSKKYNCLISFGIIKNNLYIALSGMKNDRTYCSKGWFDFCGDFVSKEFMSDIFQQFETAVMVIKTLNSK